MRISIDRDDPGFRPGLLSGFPRERFDVLLDGTLIGGVVTADEEERLVRFYSRDENGWRHDNGTLIREEMRGEVVLIPVGARALANGWILSVVHNSTSDGYSVAAWSANGQKQSGKLRWFHADEMLHLVDPAAVRLAIAEVEAAPPPSEV